MRESAGEPVEPGAGDSASRSYAEYKEGGQPSTEGLWAQICPLRDTEEEAKAHVNKHVDKGDPVDIVYLDFQKSFDQVPHQRLQGKKFVYVEPPRRVKEVLEEELYFRRDECRIKHPSEVALEGIWSLKRNFPVGGFKPASQTPSNMLPRPKYYSRHAVIRV